MNALVTVFKPGTPIGKRYSVGADGVLVKATLGQMVSGSFETREVKEVGGLVDLLVALKPGDALSSSVPADGVPASGAISTKASRVPGAWARTKKNFSFRSRVPGVLALDYDPQPDDVPMTRDAVWSVLCDVVPGIGDAGVVWWSSSSSHVCHGERDLTGLRGQRFYLLVRDAGDIPRASAALADRLWLDGHGRVVVSKSGQMLLRHLFDDAMMQPARLDFAGGALCDNPLVQRRGAPVVLGNGGALDTRLALADLSPLDAAKVEAMKRDARELADPEARQVREAWCRERATSLAAGMVRAGVGVVDAHERADHVARAAVGRVLLGDFSITLDDGSNVTIGDILDDRDRYHGRQCLDPLEPGYLGGKTVGKLYLYGAVPNLHSFCHGGATYRLMRQPARVTLATGRRAQNAEELADKLAGEGDLLRFGGVLVRVDDSGLLPIRTPAALCFLAGVRLALFKSNGRQDVPADLDDATAKMILTIA